jgi:hypothetical protein
MDAPAGIDLTAVFLDFEDEQSALSYAIASQRDRRSLSSVEILECVKALDNLKPKGGDHGNQHTGGKLAMGRQRPIDTRSAEETGELIGVGATTVKEARAINHPETPAEIKRAVADGSDNRLD